MVVNNPSMVETEDDGTNAILIIGGVKYIAWNKTTLQTRVKASYDTDQTF